MPLPNSYNNVEKLEMEKSYIGRYWKEIYWLANEILVYKSNYSRQLSGWKNKRVELQIPPSANLNFILGRDRLRLAGDFESMNYFEFKSRFIDKEIGN